MPRVRHKMRARLVPQQFEPRWEFRMPGHKDISALAQLLLDVYRGTIDDEGETLAEALSYVQGIFAGTYGTYLDTCSFMVEEQSVPIGAVLITEWKGAPLVADVATAPQARNQGLASFLLRQAMNALLRLGYTELYLFVTEGNVPAQHLYHTLGFEVVS